MRHITHIRIILSIVLLIEAAASVVLVASDHACAGVAYHLQILPSMLAASMGATLTWLAITLLFGRIYCSTVCPLGTIQDIVAFLRRKLLRRPIVHSYMPPRPIRFYILVICAVFVIAAPTLAVLLEPWSWFTAMTDTFTGTRDTAVFTRLALSAGSGIATALIMLVILVAYAALTGRSFCNHLCPVGTALGIIASRAALHIEIDPDRCTSCMKCEDECKASCISVKSRIVDNSRCVRCFNCVSRCPDDAIHLQMNRNGVMSPMMRRTSSTSPT